jgi:hypothetical protein
MTYRSLEVMIMMIIVGVMVMMTNYCNFYFPKNGHFYPGRSSVRDHMK